jgi:hypothetical protein
MVLGLIDIYQCHSPQKHSVQNSIHNLNFEIHLQFYILCDVFIFTQFIFHMFFLNKLVEV